MSSTQISSTASHLLANREHISLDFARHYLGLRQRLRTPLGAAEFLAVGATHDVLAFENRMRVALAVLELYREMFPEEYKRSSTPAFSTQREQEFYLLVHRKLFPLLLSEEVDIETHIRREPNFFLPFIPMRGTQKHIWAGGCFDFQKIETVFKVAQVLSWYTGAGGRGWAALKLIFGLSDEIEPAPPIVGHIGWPQFIYACAVQGAPLKHLPLAFHMISYKTGNPWLDLPQIGYFGYEWSGKEVARLLLAWQEAGAINERIAKLDEWLNEKPKERISLIVDLWNRAANFEQESPFAGMDGDDMRRAGANVYPMI